MRHLSCLNYLPIKPNVVTICIVTSNPNLRCSILHSCIWQCVFQESMVVRADQLRPVRISCCWHTTNLGCSILSTHCWYLRVVLLLSYICCVYFAHHFLVKWSLHSVIIANFINWITVSIFSFSSKSVSHFSVRQQKIVWFLLPFGCWYHLA